MQLSTLSFHHISGINLTLVYSDGNCNFTLVTILSFFLFDQAMNGFDTAGYIFFAPFICITILKFTILEFDTGLLIARNKISLNESSKDSIT